MTHFCQWLSRVRRPVRLGGKGGRLAEDTGLECRRCHGTSPSPLQCPREEECTKVTETQKGGDRFFIHPCEK